MVTYISQYTRKTPPRSLSESSSYFSIVCYAFNLVILQLGDTKHEIAFIFDSIDSKTLQWNLGLWGFVSVDLQNF